MFLSGLTTISNSLRANNNIQERVRGALLGLAAGDRIGGPTQMALTLSESLIDNQGFILEDIQNRYLKWWLDDGFDSGVVSSQVFKHVSEGMSFKEAAIRVHQNLDGMTAGCNPVHRNAPISLCNQLNDNVIADLAIIETSITHKHNHAAIASSTVAQLLRVLVSGIAWDTALMKIDNINSPLVSDVIKNAKSNKIKSDGYSLNVLSAAIHFVDINKTFDDALEQAIEFSGDSNYCAVLVGSLGGARWGANNISEFWLKGARDYDRLISVTNDLANEW